MRLAGGDGLMPLVGASPVYRPPVAGEPLRLREDGHWSTDRLALCCYANQGNGYTVPDLARGNHHTNVVPAKMSWKVEAENGFSRMGFVDGPDGEDHSRQMKCYTPAANFGDGTQGTLALTFLDRHFNAICWTLNNYYYGFSVSRGVTTVGFDFREHQPAAPAIRGLGLTMRHRYALTAALWTWRPDPAGAGYEVTGYIDGVQNAQVTGVVNPLWPGPIKRSEIGSRNNTIMQWMIYERYVTPIEAAALYADPTLPIWRPRRGISLAALAVPTGRPRPFTQHRHGPRLVLGGST